MNFPQKNFSATPSIKLSKNKTLLWLIAITFLLSACASSTSEKPVGSSRDDASIANSNPCTMLTPEEVEIIFNEAATADTEPTSNGPITSCSFHSDSGGRFFLIQLGPVETLEVDTDDPEVTVIEGLGDEAIFYYGSLRVRVGETVLQITTYHSSSKQAEALAMTQEVARIALDHLP